MDKDNIISLNWLKVDKATIFFISRDNKATKEEIVKDTKASLFNKSKDGALIQLLIEKIRYTPAVTRVEECTNLETGVGAAIASGSQDINGNIALLVIPAKITINLTQ